jgi:ribosomal protein L36
LFTILFYAKRRGNIGNGPIFARQVAYRKKKGFILGTNIMCKTYNCVYIISPFFASKTLVFTKRLKRTQKIIKQEGVVFVKCDGWKIKTRCSGGDLHEKETLRKAAQEVKLPAGRQ